MASSPLRVQALDFRVSDARRDAEGEAQLLQLFEIALRETGGIRDHVRVDRDVPPNIPGDRRDYDLWDGIVEDELAALNPLPADKEQLLRPGHVREHQRMVGKDILH